MEKIVKEESKSSNFIESLRTFTQWVWRTMKKVSFDCMKCQDFNVEIALLIVRRQKLIFNKIFEKMCFTVSILNLSLAFGSSENMSKQLSNVQHPLTLLFLHDDQFFLVLSVKNRNTSPWNVTYSSNVVLHVPLQNLRFVTLFKLEAAN